MCAVSAITDHYRDKWGTYTTEPNDPKVEITLKEWIEYHRLKKLMEEYDRKTNQPDCVKPEVADWEAKIETVLRKKGIIK